MLKTVTAAELEETFFKRQKELDKLIYETKDAIVLNIHYLYCIEKSRINTPEKIVRWVVHLSDKNWMTTEYMKYFVLIACNVANIEPFGV